MTAEPDSAGLWIAYQHARDTYEQLAGPAEGAAEGWDGSQPMPEEVRFALEVQEEMSRAYAAWEETQAVGS